MHKTSWWSNYLFNWSVADGNTVDQQRESLDKHRVKLLVASTAGSPRGWGCSWRHSVVIRPSAILIADFNTHSDNALSRREWTCVFRDWIWNLFTQKQQYPCQFCKCVPLSVCTVSLYRIFTGQNQESLFLLFLPSLTVSDGCELEQRHICRPPPRVLVPAFCASDCTYEYH